jgi:hypothetical protein
VVLASLPYQAVLDEDTEEWDGDNALPFEEDLE